MMSSHHIQNQSTKQLYEHHVMAQILIVSVIKSIRYIEKRQLHVNPDGWFVQASVVRDEENMRCVAIVC